MDATARLVFTQCMNLENYSIVQGMPFGMGPLAIYFI
jgi:hypothetical protein